MNYPISFPPITDEVAFCDFIPKNYLADFHFLFANNVGLFSLEEKLILIVLDRDGYFYGFQKPSPEFLHNLWKFGIYFQTFSVFNKEKTIYSCFLKQFIRANPDFKPNFILKNL